MPDLEAFEAQVKQKIKLLAAKDAKTRRAAAVWLGEAGDPTAITALAQAYKNDPDPAVQETARYALGMFRKLQQELGGDNHDKVVQLLEDVALKGKMGGRRPISTRALVKVVLGLLLSAVLIAVLSMILSRIAAAVGCEDEGEIDAEPEEKDPARFAHHAPQARMGVRHRTYSDGGNSRLMMVIDLDSIEMKPRSERSLRIRFTISRDAPTMFARSCCESFSPTISLPLL